MGYCLPDSITSISFSDPETSSRVTLATLGIVFQTNLLTNYKLGTEYWLPDKTSYQLQTWSAVWKTVPSAARVTRDAVSGFITMERTAVWKTVPPHKRSICVNPINPCSKKNSEEMKRTRIQRILSEMECSQKKTLSIQLFVTH